jgi:hypothetical protein
MTNDDEIRKYLGSLLEHRKTCKTDDCRSCLTLNRICEVIRHRIFSGFADVWATTEISRIAAGNSAAASNEQQI